MHTIHTQTHTHVHTNRTETGLPGDSLNLYSMGKLHVEIQFQYIIFNSNQYGFFCFNLKKKSSWLIHDMIHYMKNKNKSKD